jgi:hypothetical protein
VQSPVLGQNAGGGGGGMKRSKGWTLGGALTLCAGLVLPLAMGPAVGAAGRPAVVELPSGPVRVAPGTTSSAFAGYLLPNAVTSLTATWTVPRPTCSATSDIGDAASVQIDGNGAGIGDFFEFTCLDGVDDYTGTVRLFSGSGTTKPLSFTMSAGDKLVTRITTTATTATLVVTDGAKKSTKISGHEAGAGANNGWVEMQGYPPIVDFGSLKWSGVKVNGGSLASVTPVPYSLVNAEGTTLVSTSAISGGTAFTNVFHASS